MADISERNTLFHSYGISVFSGVGVYAENILQGDIAHFFVLVQNLFEVVCNIGESYRSREERLHEHLVRGGQRYACALARLCRPQCELQTRITVEIGCGELHRAELDEVELTHCPDGFLG